MFEVRLKVLARSDILSFYKTLVGNGTLRYDRSSCKITISWQLRGHV